MLFSLDSHNLRTFACSGHTFHFSEKCFFFACPPLLKNVELLKGRCSRKTQQRFICLVPMWSGDRCINYCCVIDGHNLSGFKQYAVKPSHGFCGSGVQAQLGRVQGFSISRGCSQAWARAGGSSEAPLETDLPPRSLTWLLAGLRALRAVGLRASVLTAAGWSPLSGPGHTGLPSWQVASSQPARERVCQQDGSQNLLSSTHGCDVPPASRYPAH